MDWQVFFGWFFGLWFITVPLTIFCVYFIITELLDLIFNTNRINQLLKHSDSIDSEQLEQQFKFGKEKQSNFSKSILMELDRQISYKRLNEKEGKKIWSERVSFETRKKIIAAKRVSDIFKIM